VLDPDRHGAKLHSQPRSPFGEPRRPAVVVGGFLDRPVSSLRTARELHVGELGAQGLGLEMGMGRVVELVGMDAAVGDLETHSDRSA